MKVNMVHRCFMIFLLLLLIPYIGFAQEAPVDSSRVIPQKEIIVRGQRIERVKSDPDYAPKLFPGDLRQRAASHIPQAYTPAPVISKFYVYGLSADGTARNFMEGFQLFGPSTQTLGAYGLENPDVVSMRVIPYLMSHQFTQTNAALELTPIPANLRPYWLAITTDGVERRGTLVLNQGKFVTSVRQTSVLGLLEKIEALKIIPESVDSQTLVEVGKGTHKLKGFLRVGEEHGNWKSTINGRSGTLIENTTQQFGYLKYELALPKGVHVDVGTSYEKNKIDRRHEFDNFKEFIHGKSEIINPRVTVSAADRNITAWMGKLYATSEWKEDERYERTDGGVEGKLNFRRFRVKPSAAFQKMGDQSIFLPGVTVSVYPSRTVIEVGYGEYADLFEYDNGLFRSARVGALPHPQRSTHYAVTVEYRPNQLPIIDFVRVSAVKKDFDLVWYERGANIPILAGDITFAKEGRLNYQFTYAYNHALEGGKPLVGSVRNSLRFGIASQINPNADFAIEGNYRSGMVQDIRDPASAQNGERFELDPSTYINMTASQNVKILKQPVKLTFLLYNVGGIFGNKAQVVQAGETSVYAPTIPIVRASVVFGKK